MGTEGLIVIFLCVAFFLLGWPKGLTRSLISLGGFLMAAVVGWIIGKVSSLILGPLLPWPPFYVEVIIGLAVFFGLKAILLFFAESFYDLLDDIVCEPFEDQHSFKGRLIYGLGGAMVGLINGLLLIEVCFALLLATGNVAEAEVAKASRSPNWVEVAVISFSKGIKGNSEKDLSKSGQVTVSP